MNYLVGHWCRAQAITHWYLGGRGKLISILRAKIEVTSKIIFAMGSAVENYGYYLVRWALVEGLGLLVLCEFILGFTIRVYHLLICIWVAGPKLAGTKVNQYLLPVQQKNELQSKQAVGARDSHNDKPWED